MAWPGVSYTVPGLVVLMATMMSYKYWFVTDVDKKSNESDSTVDQIQELKSAVQEMTSKLQDIKASVKSSNDLKIQEITDLVMSKSQYLQSMKNELETYTAVKNRGGNELSYEEFKKLLRHEIQEQVDERIQLENQKRDENLAQILEVQNSKIEKLEKILSEKEGPVEKLLSRISEMIMMREILNYSLPKSVIDMFEKFGNDKQYYDYITYITVITPIFVLLDAVLFIYCIKRICRKRTGDRKSNVKKKKKRTSLHSQKRQHSDTDSNTEYRQYEAEHPISEHFQKLEKSLCIISFNADSVNSCHVPLSQSILSGLSFELQMKRVVIRKPDSFNLIPPSMVIMVFVDSNEGNEILEHPDRDRTGIKRETVHSLMDSQALVFLIYCLEPSSRRLDIGDRYAPKLTGITSVEESRLLDYKHCVFSVYKEFNNIQKNIVQRKIKEFVSAH